MGRDAEKLAAAVAELGQAASAVAVDVTDLNALMVALGEAANRLGGIDILFANAALPDAPPLEHTTEADYDRLMDSM